MKNLGPLFFLLLIFSVASGQTNIGGVINSYTSVTSIDTTTCTPTVAVTDSTIFQPGDRVLIIQMKGAAIDTSNTSSFGTVTSYNNAGNYEFNFIQSISGNTVTLQNPLIRNYNPNHLVQLIKVPVYTSATVTAPLTALPWNGTVGGILALEVNNKLTVNAPITADTLGFMGGNPSLNYHSGCTAMGYKYPIFPGWSGGKGESIVMLPTSMVTGRGAAASGGGGGNHVNAGGAGGGNGGAGGNGGNEWITCSSLPIGGDGGNQLAYSNTLNKIFLGGGGGGGHQNNSNTPKGGNGGGIIIIKADTITGNGIITANGGKVTQHSGIDAASGGGGGGVVLISANTYLGSFDVEAKGGHGGDVGTNISHGPGGGGGGGTIWYANVVPSTYTNNVSGDTAGVTVAGHYGAESGDTGVVLANLILPEGAPTSFSVNLGSDTTLCAGDSIALASPVTGASYLWSTLDTTSTIYVSNPGAYWVLVEKNNCVLGDTVIISNFPVAVASADTSICTQDSAKIHAQGAISYNWIPSNSLSSPQDSTTFAYPSSTTTYSVIADYANCPDDTLEIQVVVHPLPPVTTIPDTTICLWDSLQLSTVGASSYNWLPSSAVSNDTLSNPYFLGNSSTTLMVTGISVFGCKAQDSVVVHVDSLNLSVSSDTSICQGDTINIFATGANSYLWSAGQVGISDSNSASPLIFPDSSTFFTVTASKGKCVTMDSILVNVLSVQNFSVEGDTILCLGDSTSISAAGGDNYQWYTNSGSIQQSAILSVQPAATLLYHVIISDQCSLDTLDVLVEVQNPPMVSAGPDTTICIGDSIQLNGQGGNTYNWSSANNLNDSTHSNPIFSGTSTSTLYLVGFDSLGCYDVDSITIVVDSINLQVFSDTTLCYGDTTSLSATGGMVYSWSPLGSINSPFASSTLAYPDTTTTFFVTGSTLYCSATDSVTVSVIQPSSFSTSLDTLVCTGEQLTLSASGGVFYEWYENGNLIDTTGLLTVSPSQSTTYNVVVSDQCFSDTFDISIVIQPLPSVNAGIDTTVFQGTEIALTGQSTGVFNQWLPAEHVNCPQCLFTTATTNQSSSFILQATDHYGCTNQDTVFITILDCSPLVAIPNAFSPNGDHLNDTFHVINASEVGFEELRIYNRWGELIFLTKDPFEGWDGTFKGKDQGIGVYVYVVLFSCGQGDRMKKGNITLVR